MPGPSQHPLTYPGAQSDPSAMPMQLQQPVMRPALVIEGEHTRWSLLVAPNPKAQLVLPASASASDSARQGLADPMPGDQLAPRALASASDWADGARLADPSPKARLVASALAIAID